MASAIREIHDLIYGNPGSQNRKKSVSRSASGKFYGLRWQINLSFLNSRTNWPFVKNDDNSKWCIVTTDKLTEDAPTLDSPIELKPFWASADPTNPKLAWLSDQGNISHINQSNLAPVAQSNLAPGYGVPIRYFIIMADRTNCSARVLGFVTTSHTRIWLKAYS